MSFHYHLPRRCKDRCGTLSLPELDVEFAIALAHLAESLHDPRSRIVLALAHYGYHGTRARTPSRMAAPSGFEALQKAFEILQEQGIESAAGDVPGEFQKPLEAPRFLKSQ